MYSEDWIGWDEGDKLGEISSYVDKVEWKVGEEATCHNAHKDHKDKGLRRIFPYYDVGGNIVVMRQVSHCVFWL